MSKRRSFAGVIAVVACAWLATPNAVEPVPASSVSLDIPGRADATPWVAASGSFVAVAWGASAGGKADVFLAVSRDGGASFAAPVQVNTVAGEARLGGELPPRVALVARRGSAVPGIAVLWTARGKTTDIKVARSTDGGKTFGAVVTVQSLGAAGDRGWPSVTFDRQGRMHAVWLDHRGLAANRAAGSAHAHQAGAQHDGVAMAQKSGLYYASPGGARQGSRERELAKGVCYCCKTALAAGPDGSLYTAWRHVYPGNLRDMAFAVSRDGGRSFSAPVRVNEDRWAINGCPDDGPAIAVEAGGTVHLAWPTVVQGAHPQGIIHFASTRDGRRFSSPVRVPTLGGLKPTHPQIAATAGGRIFVAWEEGLNGQRIAAVREVRLQSGRAPAFGDVITLSADSATYPVLAATDRGLVGVWVTGADQSRVEARALIPR